MFVILVYDAEAKRTSKILKICRRYLYHVQRSVFEGTLTEKQLNKLKDEINRIIVKETDQISIYKFDSLKYSSKEIIGPYQQKTNCI